MADRLPATISIGGALPTSLRSSLAEVIAFQGCRDEFGNGYLTAEEAATLIEAAARDQKVLTFSDGEASGGMFEELESFLRQNGVCYKRTNDARYEIDCAVVLFDGSSLVEHLANKSGAVAVTAKRLEQAQAEGTLEALIAELCRIEAGVPPLSDGPNPWQVQALVAELEAVGALPEALDELVHEAAAAVGVRIANTVSDAEAEEAITLSEQGASEVNNGGLTAQVPYILAAFGPDEGARLIRDATSLRTAA